MVAGVTVTNPVTQVEVVAVNNASIKGKLVFEVCVIGNISNNEPKSIVKAKLDIMMWVVFSVGGFLSFLSISNSSFLNVDKIST